jgi:PBP1b-binding outer membrane lipoprotein LpoB
MRPLLILFSIVIMASCARIPAASVELNQEINREIERLHRLNVAFTQQLFESKKELVRQFIKYEYSPDFIARSLSALKAAGYHVEDSLETVVYQLSMQINERESGMIRQLEAARDSTLQALDMEYQLVMTAGNEMQRFLKSAASVEKERKEIYALTNQIMNQRFDLRHFEQQLNQLVLKAGEGSSQFMKINEAFLPEN